MRNFVYSCLYWFNSSMVCSYRLSCGVVTCRPITVVLRTKRTNTWKRNEEEWCAEVKGGCFCPYIFSTYLMSPEQCLHGGLVLWLQIIAIDIAIALHWGIAKSQPGTWVVFQRCPSPAEVPKSPSSCVQGFESAAQVPKLNSRIAHCQPRWIL